MYLHLEFMGGSNPFVQYLPEGSSAADCEKQQGTWRKRFDVLSLEESHGGLYATLRERGQEWQKL